MLSPCCTTVQGSESGGGTFSIMCMSCCPDIQVFNTNTSIPIVCHTWSWDGYMLGLPKNCMSIWIFWEISVRQYIKFKISCSVHGHIAKCCDGVTVDILLQPGRVVTLIQTKEVSLIRCLLTFARSR